MKNHNFLNVFNIATALNLLETGKDYANMSDDNVMIVAHDQTVWVCTLEGVSLNDAKLVQRIV